MSAGGIRRRLQEVTYALEAGKIEEYGGMRMVMHELTVATSLLLRAHQEVAIQMQVLEEMIDEIRLRADLSLCPKCGNTMVRIRHTGDEGKVEHVEYECPFCEYRDTGKLHPDRG